MAVPTVQEEGSADHLRSVLAFPEVPSMSNQMIPEQAIELTLAALADLPSGPPSEEILSVIQAAAWDEGVSDGQWNAEHAYQIEAGTRTAIPNPYRSEA